MRIFCFWVALCLALEFGCGRKIDISAGISVQLHLLPADEEKVRFNISGQIPDATDWLAFGFSMNGGVTEIDLALIRAQTTQDDATFVAQDLWIDFDFVIHVDAQQDWTILGVQTSADFRNFYLLLERKWNTCDKDDIAVDAGTTQVVIAVGQGNFEGLLSANYKITPMRLQLVNNAEINFLGQESDFDQFTEDTPVDFLAPEVTIPGDETTYWCYINTISNLQTKLHVTEVEPIISSENKQFVHHMELFHCMDEGVNIADLVYSGPCDKVPKAGNSCKNVVAAWAMGAESFRYPSEAGLSIGGPQFFPYYRLEIHYNNQERKKGVKDSSGFRLHMTEKLRRFDAGVMEVGLEYTDKMAIPPRQSSFPLIGYCVPECTYVGLPASGINIFASQLHAHLSGHVLRTDHIDASKIQHYPLNYDNHFITHWQEIRPVIPHRTVYPGDTLTTICKYDTRDRDTVTMGGYGIRDEMCVNYVHYYPKVDLEVCKSSIDTQMLANAFGLIDKFESPNATELYHKVKWDQISADALRDLYKKSTLSVQCTRNNGLPFSGVWSDIAQPKIVESTVSEIEKMCE